jgi:hypothetical protein
MPWNRFSKSRLLHGERQNSGTVNYAAQRFSVMRIEVDAKSNS